MKKIPQARILELTPNPGSLLPRLCFQLLDPENPFPPSAANFQEALPLWPEETRPESSQHGEEGRGVSLSTVGSIPVWKANLKATLKPGGQECLVLLSLALYPLGPALSSTPVSLLPSDRALRLPIGESHEFHIHRSERSTP